MLSRTPEEVAAAVDLTARTEDGKGNKDGSFYAFTSAEMRGAPVAFTLGDVHLQLTPLKRRILRDKFVPLLEMWPRVLQFAAAVQKPKTPGIDAESVAFLMSLYEASEHGKEEQERQRRAIKAGQTFEPTPAPDAVTEEAVRRLAGALVDSFDDYLPAICDTIWLMAEGTPGLAWPRPDAPLPEIEEGSEPEEREWKPEPPTGCEWLDDYLDDRLYLPDYADLLRGCLVANGTFPGSTYDRFASA